MCVTASPTNTWEALSGVTVTTGAWHRVTIEKDYAAGKYRLYLDGRAAAVGGDWFNMVGTANTYMSRIRVLGGSSEAPAYLDDVVVGTQLPDFFPRPGSLFMFR
jgi:hypothetical protein